PPQGGGPSPDGHRLPGSCYDRPERTVRLTAWRTASSCTVENSSSGRRAASSIGVRCSLLAQLGQRVFHVAEAADEGGAVISCGHCGEGPPASGAESKGRRRSHEAGARLAELGCRKRGVYERVQWVYNLFHEKDLLGGSLVAVS